MRLVLLGAPGSGKGTQAELLKERYGCVHISTGDILRQNLRARSKLGLEAEAYMKQGALVPDQLVLEMVRKRLNENDLELGFLLDGFPRTVPQAEALETVMEELRWDLNAVLLFAIDPELVVRRLTKRRTCRSCAKVFNLLTMQSASASCPACGGELFQRDDDTEPVILNRLKVYRERTAPLIAWYEGKKLLRVVDASRTPADTFKEIETVLA